MARFKARAVGLVTVSVIAIGLALVTFWQEKLSTVQAAQQDSIYVVEKGDSLFTIANKLDVSLEALAMANGLAPNSTLHKKQELTIPSTGSTGATLQDVWAPSEADATAEATPGPTAEMREEARAQASAEPTHDAMAEADPAGTTAAVTYQVQAGDSLNAIAKKYGVSLQALAAANGLNTNSILNRGQQLTIPTPGTIPSAAVMPPPAAPTEDAWQAATAEATETVMQEATVEPTAEMTDEATAEPDTEMTEVVTPEATETVMQEATPEATEASMEDATAEATAELTDEATAEPGAEVTEEATPEATEASMEDATAEATAELTDEATAEPDAEMTEEATPEATEASMEDATAEATAELTDEATAEPDAEVTEEATPEATEASMEDATAEATAEMTDEATAEPDAEVTEEATSEATAEMTDEPTGTATEEPPAEATEVVRLETDILDAITALGNFTTLLKTLESAGLTETLKTEGPFTLFAPTDAAFAALPEGTIDGLLASSPDDLSQILLYHILPGEILSADLADGTTIVTAQGGTVAVTVTPEGIKINDATITISDIETSNGVIHVIDAVLLPSENMATVPIGTVAPTVVEAASGDAASVIIVQINITDMTAAAHDWDEPAGHIVLFSPVATGGYHSPVEIIGLSHTFEGTIAISLVGSDGTMLAQRMTLGGADAFAFFQTKLRFDVAEATDATLNVLEIDMADGSILSSFDTPITLLPGQRVVDVHSPTVGEAICNQILVSGYSNTYEANVVLTLSEPSGEIVTQMPTMGGSMGTYRDFAATLPYTVNEATPLLLSVAETDASGMFSTIDETRIPVTLYPSVSTACN